MRGACGCRNHNGNPKVKYPDKEAALAAILDRHLKHGPHEVVRCPRMPDVFHVRSLRAEEVKR